MANGRAFCESEILAAKCPAASVPFYQTPSQYKCRRGLQRPLSPASRGEHQANSDATDEPAEVRGEAHLGAPKVKGRLNGNNGDDVLQLTAGQRRLAMTQKQTGRDTNHTHDATRSAHEQIGF